MTFSQRECMERQRVRDQGLWVVKDAKTRFGRLRIGSEARFRLNCVWV